MFHLVPANTIDNQELLATADVPLYVLRERAIGAATEVSQGEERLAKRIYYERCTAVRDYVLARANGTCESCQHPAPFKKHGGDPYLEPHHTRRVSDGGPDHPLWVAAVCPNCHREIHSGENGAAKNAELQRKVREFESNS